MTHAVELQTAGFEDLSNAEMVEVNGGGWWAAVAAFCGQAFTWPIVIGAIVINTLWDLPDAWSDFWEGFESAVYGT